MRHLPAALLLSLLALGTGCSCSPEAACERDLDCFVSCDCGSFSSTRSHACVAGFCAPPYLDSLECAACGGRGPFDDDDAGDDDSTFDDDDSTL